MAETPPAALAPAAAGTAPQGATAPTSQSSGATPADDAPDLVQLLTPQGERVPHAAYDARVAHLTPDDLRAMYRDMVLTRRFDTEATSLQRQGELALWAQCLGQEAAQVGSAHALAPQDFVFPSYREHGVLYTRGVDPLDVLSLFRGVDHGAWDPRQHNTHLYTLVIGSHTLHATGYAMGVQRDGLVGTGDPARDTAVVAYFGDGATAQGDTNEAMVFAAVNDAPLVLFCQNNQWAISEPTTHQARVPIADRGPGFGIPSVRVDGNDVLACYAVTAEALERAHSGGGPTLVEAFTYRMGAHTTSDDPSRYRSSEEEESWRRRDPIDRLRVHLESIGELSAAFVAELDAEGDALGARLREGVRAMTAPAPSAMFDGVYATPHAGVAADRAWFTEYDAALDDGGLPAPVAASAEGSTR